MLDLFKNNKKGNPEKPDENKETKEPKTEEKEEEVEKKEAPKEDKPVSGGAQITRLSTELDRVKASVEGFQEIRKSFTERFTRISEQIGELRSMILERDKSIQEIELKAIKSADLVEAVHPEKTAGDHAAALDAQDYAHIAPFEAALQRRLRLPGIAESVPRSSLFLTDDESDLVYHVVCSRAAASDDHPRQSLSACWFTTDADAPRVKAMPERYERVFHRMDEYNRDALRVLARKRRLRSDQIELPQTRARAAVGCILRFFQMADVLADSYQSLVHKTLAATYALAALTGLMFILYSEFDDMELSIFGFLGFLALGIVLVGIARRRQWHRKYLDYRVLAEGLRVQYFWAIAGIHGEGHTKFAYDNFLRQRDMELGWIRNVMRVAGTPGDAEAATPDDPGLNFVIDNWIGSADNPGQLHYYGEKAKARSRMHMITEAIIMGCLWAGIGVALVLAFFSPEINEMRHTLIILMGVLPLIAGVAEVYTQRKADRELTKQYVFMEHVFANARRRIDQAGSAEEKREVLQGLGDAALSEHAEWILIHRERQPEPGGL